MLVVDASVLVAYVSGDERAATAEEVINDPGGLSAPHLIDAEVGHALRRLVATETIELDRAERALADLAEMPLQRSPHTFLIGEAWGMRARASFYDALYLALAKLMELRLVSFDRGLADVAPAYGIEAELLA